MVATDAYEVLAEKHGFAGSARYRRILEFLMTPQQANIAAELPKTPDELGTKLGIDVSIINQELDRLFRKGVVFPRNFQTLETCRFARRVMQLHDATLSALRLDPVRHSTIFKLWDDFAQNEWYPALVDEWSREIAPLTRVVPAYEAIKDLPDVLPWENAHELVKAASLIAVVSCTCRKRAAAVGHKCQKSHDGVCLQFNRSAEYALARGSGTRLSVEEALEIVKESEEDGLVHTWVNAAAMLSPTMCNCCTDCCEVLEPLIRFKVPVTKQYAKSRYEAGVDQDLCTGCQICLDRCQFDAIEMVKVPGSKKLKALINPEKCIGCGVCVITCKDEAMAMKAVRPVEHIPAAP